MYNLELREVQPIPQDPASICLKLKLGVLNLMGVKLQIGTALLKTYAVEEHQMA